MTNFALYFASIVSIQYHPRNEPENRMSLNEAAKIAEKMVIIEKEYNKCLSQQQ